MLASGSRDVVGRGDFGEMIRMKNIHHTICTQSMDIQKLYEHNNTTLYWIISIWAQVLKHKYSSYRRFNGDAVKRCNELNCESTRWSHHVLIHYHEEVNIIGQLLPMQWLSGGAMKGQKKQVRNEISFRLILYKM